MAVSLPAINPGRPGSASRIAALKGSLTAPAKSGATSAAYTQYVDALVEDGSAAASGQPPAAASSVAFARMAAAVAADGTAHKVSEAVLSAARSRVVSAQARSALAESEDAAAASTAPFAANAAAARPATAAALARATAALEAVFASAVDAPVAAPPTPDEVDTVAASVPGLVVPPAAAVQIAGALDVPLPAVSEFAALAAAAGSAGDGVEPAWAPLLAAAEAVRRVTVAGGTAAPPPQPYFPLSVSFEAAAAATAERRAAAMARRARRRAAADARTQIRDEAAAHMRRADGFAAQRGAAMARGDFAAAEAAQAAEFDAADAAHRLLASSSGAAGPGEGDAKRAGAEKVAAAARSLSDAVAEWQAVAAARRAAMEQDAVAVSRALADVEATRAADADRFRAAAAAASAELAQNAADVDAALAAAAVAARARRIAAAVGAAEDEAVRQAQHAARAAALRANLEALRRAAVGMARSAAISAYVEAAAGVLPAASAAAVAESDGEEEGGVSVLDAEGQLAAFARLYAVGGELACRRAARVVEADGLLRAAARAAALAPETLDAQVGAYAAMAQDVAQSRSVAVAACEDVQRRVAQAAELFVPAGDALSRAGVAYTHPAVDVEAALAQRRAAAQSVRRGHVAAMLAAVQLEDEDIAQRAATLSASSQSPPRAITAPMSH